MADNLLETVLNRRDEAGRKAWDALSKYKFWMFGYWAAAYIKYNQLLSGEHRAGNPFRALVKLARVVILGDKAEPVVLDLKALPHPEDASWGELWTAINNDDAEGIREGLRKLAAS